MDATPPFFRLDLRLPARLISPANFATFLRANEVLMNFLAALWLPIVLSAVIVFVASSILHMVLKYHQSDCFQLANEDQALAALRTAGVKPGYYHFPIRRTRK